MRYVGNVIRPPSEARSLIVQVTTGCSHNRCHFCGAYPQKFTIKPLDLVKEDLDWFASNGYKNSRRLFLADGNALIRKTDDLLAIIEAAKSRLPKMRRVALYANANDVLRKSDDELRTLSEAGVRIAYLGLESGDDDVLERMEKGATAAEMVEAVQRLQRAEIKASVIALLGLAGADREASEKHARATAQAINAMQPRYISFLTVMVIPGTKLHQSLKDGAFVLPEPKEILKELRTITSLLELERCVFRANHASNYLPLSGTMSRDREKLLATIDEGLSGRVGLVPEFFRGL